MEDRGCDSVKISPLKKWKKKFVDLHWHTLVNILDRSGVARLDYYDWWNDMCMMYCKKYKKKVLL